MKKYLNRNIFFQGDAKICSLLISLLILTWVLLESYVNSSNYYRWILYSDLNYGYNTTPLGGVGIIILVIFLTMSFMIVCGIFKRKKWSTLLSGPFSRMDIRKRELTLMICCIVGFILIFLLVCIRYAIANETLISYIKGFWLLVGIDIIRIVIVSLSVISVLFCIDSLTSNMYVTLAALFSIATYCGVIIATIANLFLWGYNPKIENVNVWISNTIEAILIGNKEYVYSYNLIIAIMLLLLLTSVCFIIAKRLTKKIRIENMGDALIFRPIMKILPFLLSTFIGMVVGNIIFRNLLFSDKIILDLNQITYPIVRFSIIISISIVCNVIIRCFRKSLKNKIPKKYI